MQHRIRYWMSSDLIVSYKEVCEAYAVLSCFVSGSLFCIDTSIFRLIQIPHELRPLQQQGCLTSSPELTNSNLLRIKALIYI